MKYALILGSSSPRRQYLMHQAGFEFEIRKPEVEEDFPQDMPVMEVASFLARKKCGALLGQLQKADGPPALIITADTTVVLGSAILNKPADRIEAIDMLSRLSGQMHTVVTGVCMATESKQLSFDDHTEVLFNTLTQEEIHYYVDHFAPYDKAGGYGAQDWIGMVAIKEIRGSYFNVMGLPIHRVYQEIKNWS